MKYVKILMELSTIDNISNDTITNDNNSLISFKDDIVTTPLTCLMSLRSGYFILLRLTE